MNKYIVIYHYSPNANLEIIDPAYYGSCATRGAECKRGKNGLDKSYYYTEDKPESCVRGNNTRYEIYLPDDWKMLIYNIGEDPENLVEQAKVELLQEKNFVYPQELKDRVELLIIGKGYKGFYNPTFTSLPHVLCLYYPLSTHKPEGEYTVAPWNDKLNMSNHCSFFAAKSAAINDHFPACQYSQTMRC